MTQFRAWPTARSSPFARRIRSSRRAIRSAAETAAPIDDKAPTIVALASAPSSWPPMPSATAKTPISGATSRLSSFWARFTPGWLMLPVSIRRRSFGSGAAADIESGEAIEPSR